MFCERLLEVFFYIFLVKIIFYVNFRLIIGKEERFLVYDLFLGWWGFVVKEEWRVVVGRYLVGFVLVL